LKQNISLKYIDIGGGWAAQFERESILPHPDDYVSAISDLFTNLPVTVVAEPGRSLIGNAGVLIMKVIRMKKGPSGNFCIVDAGMNDFIRPVLYGANHRIEPVYHRPGRKAVYDIVGPVCENSDFLAKSISLPALEKGDILALFTAGAYGRVMSSNYNGRLRAAEVAVAGSNVFSIGKRDDFRDLVRGQRGANISKKMVEDLL
jgi:diaminopimelate decarboxylase